MRRCRCPRHRHSLPPTARPCGGTDAPAIAVVPLVAAPPSPRVGSTADRILLLSRGSMRRCHAPAASSLAAAGSAISAATAGSQ